VPIARFSTRTRTGAAAARRAVVDVRHLLWFRTAAVRRKRSARAAGLIFLGFTAAVAFVPAYLPGAGIYDRGRAWDVLLLLPTALAGMLFLAVISAVASGGGRELLSHEHGVAYPVSATTDHLGALILAPLNIAWLLQAWILLGAAAYALGSESILRAQLVTLLWILVATALAQVLAWSMEAIRRREHGVTVVRGMGLTLAGIAVWLQLTGHITAALDRVPTRLVVRGMVAPRAEEMTRWIATTLGLLVVAVAAIAIGAIPAHLAARRAPRDAIRTETGARQARKDSRSDLLALLRIDRASVWRAVPMRRGLMVLAIGPGIVALAGGLQWDTMTILPGLVASGAALLFGVNAWCLDARGALWRASVPADPRTVFAARLIVLVEWLVVASGITIVLGSLRAGVPEAHELAALLCAWVVVILQVVGGSMRWSQQRPFAVDLRSARATPAPPVLMVGYSSRLALTTTMTGLLFSGMARLPYWNLSIALAIPFVAWSVVRLVWVRRSWLDPVERARVVMTVAA
jgi:hypothetical protein